MYSDKRWHQSSPSHAAGRNVSLPSSPRTVSSPPINLPPSIPISLDGEEGAFAYSQHLLQMNTDTKQECYQPPPNRTIHRRLSTEDEFPDSSFLMQLTSDQQNRSKKANIDTSVSEQWHSQDSKQSGHFLASPPKGALPAIPYQSSRDLATGDYVSSSFLAGWRSSSSDRTVMRDSVVLPTAATKPQQQRSSSADSVRRIVKRFFVKKLGSRSSQTKQEPLVSHTTEHNIFEKFDDLGACAGIKGGAKGTGDAPWDLPPNYVDMIFTRDPITKENVSDVVESDLKSGIHKL